MTKERILEAFKDINAVYNDSSKYDTLSGMIDELLESQQTFRKHFFNRCAALTRCDTCEICAYYEQCEKERTL